MTGRRLLHFEVLEKLGEGGMGAVYRALDTRLNRHVAIKVLPGDKLSDPDRKRRFIHEAQTASALNHPNIVTIHDVAADGEVQFIVMELVSGRTLDACIGGKPLPLGEALRYAVQVADALAAAHAAGIIHRDLKPGNIMVTGNGLVKVLDFGLAKLTEQVTAGESTPTISLEPPRTNPGTIVGTASYMAPEQAEGRRTDARSDIFSFGAVVYEMLSGRRAFTGESQLAILSAVLRAEPKPLADLVPGLPVELDRAVGRCLRKDPDRRFQTMADLKVVLQESHEESDSGRIAAAAQKPAAGRRRRWLWPAAGVLCLLASGGVGLWLYQRPGGPPGRLIPITSFPGIESNGSLSPDGTKVAFAWNGEKEDNFDIYVKQVDGEGFTRLTTDPAPEGIPRWSPDGRSIAFNRFGKDPAIMIIPAMGGPARRLPSKRSIYGWTADAKSLLLHEEDGVADCIAVMSIETGQIRQLTFPPKSSPGDSLAAASPDGRTVAFFRAIAPGKLSVHTVPITGGEPRAITSPLRTRGGLCWTADSKEIVFSSDRGDGVRLWRVRASASPNVTPELVKFAGEDAIEPQIAGNRLVYTKRHVRTNLWRTALDGKPAEPTRMLASTREDHHPAYSPDGKRIAFVSDRTGNPELWVATAEGENPVRLTALTVALGPIWSPDNQSIAFGAQAASGAELYVVSADGGTPRRIGNSDFHLRSWSRDGKWIYGLMNVGTLQIFKIRLEGGEPVQVTRNGGFQAQESADGRYLLYTKLPTMDGAVPSSFWRMPVGGGEEVQIYDAIYSWRWQPSGNGIYFVDFQQVRTPEKAINFLDIETKEVKRVAVVNKASSGLPGFTISPDGRWIITTHGEPPIADIMLVDNFH